MRTKTDRRNNFVHADDDTGTFAHIRPFGKVIGLTHIVGRFKLSPFYSGVLKVFVPLSLLSTLQKQKKTYIGS